MSAIQPKGEKLRQAVKWISGKLGEEDSEQSSRDLPRDIAHRDLHELIQQAALKFNLSPREEEFLNSFYGKGEGQEQLD